MGTSGGAGGGIEKSGGLLMKGLGGDRYGNVGICDKGGGIIRGGGITNGGSSGRVGGGGDGTNGGGGGEGEGDGVLDGGNGQHGKIGGN